MADKPYRLKLPSPRARVAIGDAVAPQGPFNIADPIVMWVPIATWAEVRIRGLVTGQAGTVGLEFGRPARQLDAADVVTPKLEYIYTVGQPAADGTAWVAGTEFVLNITATEHIGENWLKVTLTATVNGATLVFLDVSGVMLGTNG